MSNLSDLVVPNEIFELIILASDAQTIINICRTNKKYETLRETGYLWKRYITDRSFTEFISILEQIKSTKVVCGVYREFISLNIGLRPFTRDPKSRPSFCGSAGHPEENLFKRVKNLKSRLISSLFNSYSIALHGDLTDLNETSPLFIEYECIYDLFEHHIKWRPSNLNRFSSFINSFMKNVIVKDKNIQEHILRCYPDIYKTQLDANHIPFRKDLRNLQMIYCASSFIINNLKQHNNKEELISTVLDRFENRSEARRMFNKAMLDRYVKLYNSRETHK